MWPTDLSATPSHLGPLPCLLEMSLESIARNVPQRRFTLGPRSPPVLRSPEFACVFTSLPPPQPDTEAPVTLPSITTFWPCPSAEADYKHELRAGLPFLSDQDLEPEA